MFSPSISATPHTTRTKATLPILSLLSAKKIRDSSLAKISRSLAGICVSLANSFLGMGIIFGIVPSAHAGGYLQVCNHTNQSTSIAVAYVHPRNSFKKQFDQWSSNGWWTIPAHECIWPITKYDFPAVTSLNGTSYYDTPRVYYIYFNSRFSLNTESSGFCLRRGPIFEISIEYDKRFDIVKYNDAKNSSAGTTSLCGDLGSDYEFVDFEKLDTGDYGIQYTLNLR